MSSETDTTAPDLENASDFVRAAGLRIAEAGPERVVGWIDLGPAHHTPWGVVHGGVFLSAVESAASIGASAAVADRGLIAVGVHNGTDFVRGAYDGRADVVATPLQQGSGQQLWQVLITRASDGKTLAHGKLRLQNVAPRARG
ncbi:PaaI family thioesterase [Gordonia desulfuricans]|uniref:PaaI family thioesterase n=1 Tax=Gordonia desulfuricans TaxID=89051 RepID=A0A7K3LSE8_9ACTN|nr:PaaI family thioesterase [Gordonia desulfuricans]NDK91214.1 PaaI family thioesterase [Gordonia desulfuricans]